MGRKIIPDNDDEDIKALMSDDDSEPEEKLVIKRVAENKIQDGEEDYSKALPGISASVEINKLKSYAYDLIAFIDTARSKIAEAQEKLLETNKKIQDLTESTK